MSASLLFVLILVAFWDGFAVKSRGSKIPTRAEFEKAKRGMKN